MIANHDLELSLINIVIGNYDRNLFSVDPNSNQCDHLFGANTFASTIDDHDHHCGYKLIYIACHLIEQ